MGFESIFWLVLSIITAFLISYAFMPAIIKIAGLKELIDKPEGEKITTSDAPKLGGMGIFAAFLIAFSIWGYTNQLESFPFLIASLFMLILTGINDDILELTTSKKLIIQLLASAEIVVAGKVAITSFGGLFGIYEVPFWIGAVITILIFVIFVNSFNFISSIDVLAGGVGIIISSIFGIWFLGAGFYSLSVLSFVMSGALLGFLIYNMHPSKISLGETGSLIIGFILAYIAIQFIQLNGTIVGTPWHVENSIGFALAVLIVPATDVIRVLFIRLLSGKNPFKTTLNHSHRELLESGIDQGYFSFSYWIVNLLVISFAYWVGMFIDPSFLFIVVTILGLMMLPAVKILHNGIASILNLKDKKIYFKNISSK